MRCRLTCRRTTAMGLAISHTRHRSDSSASGDRQLLAGNRCSNLIPIQVYPTVGRATARRGGAHAIRSCAAVMVPWSAVLPCLECSAIQNRRSAWGCSSAGRAPALQAGGRGFEDPIISTAPQRGTVSSTVGGTSPAQPMFTLFGRIEHPEPPMLTRQERTRKAVPTTRVDVRSVPATAVTTGWTERRACCAVPSLARENRASEGDQLWTVTRRSPSMD